MKDNSYIIIKCGGSVLESLTDEFYKYLHDLWIKNKNKILLIHGGGVAIKAQEQALNIESEFINGLRKTSNQTLRVIKQILNGELNTNLVLKLMSHNMDAFGVSGVDGSLIQAEIKDYENLGYVGTNLTVNKDLLIKLLNLDKLLVVSSLALHKQDHNQALNINADTMCLAIAKSLQAGEVIFVSDVDGVLNEQKQLINQLSIKECNQLIQDKIITDGMIPKVESCMELINNGINQVKIINGQNNNLTQGTTFIK